MTVIAFTKRYTDRSTPEGFQFEFFCDRTRSSWQEFLQTASQEFLAAAPSSTVENCSFSYTTPLIKNPAGVTAKLVEDAKKFSESEAIGAAGKLLNQVVNEKAKEIALGTAITRAKGYFRYCTECNRWVCKDNCWNHVVRLCKDCAPAAVEPVALACQHCGEYSLGGRFCAHCGQALVSKIFCGNCGSHIDGDKHYRYCPMCGDSLSYIFGSR